MSAARFWRQVDVLDMRSCWRWRGTEQGSYGAFAVDGEQVRAHRYAWAFAYGEIPTGMHVLHGCDNSWCVNPRHLRIGTHEDNNADKSVLSRVQSTIAEADRADEEAARVVPNATVRVDPVDAALPIHGHIKRLRIALGLNQGEFARAVGVAKSVASDWESGAMAPKRARLAQVAAVLGVTVAELFAVPA